ncbi:MAG: hypothetical protein JRF30_12615 [Deltaproteobacteria bacterium]|nr:hypothetical protein [Deltaproteobacteria bacterium]
MTNYPISIVFRVVAKEPHPKHFSSGQIGVTEEVVERTDNTLVQFIRPATIEITKKRKINTFLANYEDPRLIKLSSLAHALFIADPSGAEVRQKAVEAMIIESLFEIGDESMSFSRFSEWIRAKQIPEPSPIEFRKIGESSKYLRCDEQGTVCYETDTRTKIQSIQAAFDSAQEKAIINVAGNVAKQSGISEELVRQRIDIKSLIEEYLCSAFLQIRMMANYFRSTRVLFERLSTYKELDYIILKYFKRVAPDRPEEFIIFKRAFLEAVKTLAESNNVYIASIFHNVLLLYYLNRNSQLSRGQLAAIKEKEIYLDTNTLYAHVCKASNFNTALAFVLSKLHKLGAKVFLFDRSLIEYLGSLESTLHKYRSKSHYDFIEGGPWIWKEFISNVGRYRSDFEYCVALHKIPKDLPKLETDFFDRARQELRKINIELIRLEPFLDKDDLGGLYYKVYDAKLKFDPSSQWYMPKYSQEQYHQIVLHDANCLNKLGHPATNPFSAKKLFVTCDFGLAKIRRREHDKFEFLVTVPEFYEFMLPYLFMENLMVKQPVEMPNFLLASILYRELFESIDFKDLFGKYIADNIDNLDDFKILEELNNTKRYRDLKEKYSQLSTISSDSKEFEDNLNKFFTTSTELLAEYDRKIRNSLATSFAQEELNARDRELKEMGERLKELEKKVQKFEDKEKKRKKYIKKKRKK